MADEQNQTQGGGQVGDDKMTFVTKEGLQKIQEELENLKNVKRKDVVERIKEAITYGDLSENSEYEDAKNEQAFVEGRIIELEDKVKYAKIIDEKKKSANQVRIGSTVTIRRVGKKSAESEEYIVVGSTEADPVNGKISNESPVGKALLGKEDGETVKVSAPAGFIEYEIVKVK
ncbi:MAG: transcription elongation factor GreA, transcription elongation factor GreA [Candidatus Peregrinibacteria bacterium GW2011_GWF2_38_29]|nr:MAG: transcription elongation factor GreA, transcription elongation factor GreA [Candidatus Peregrinibacteria bacterium GW2011_GWF2_38_29]